MTRSKFAALAGGLNVDPEPVAVESVAADPAPRPPPDLKKLTARIPLDVFHEFAQHRLDAERAAQLRRVTTEAGVEGLVRLLRDPEIRAAWHRELQRLDQE